VLINDLPKLYKGPLRLAIEQNGKIIAEKITNCQIDALDRTVISFDMEIPKEDGQYQLIAELTKPDGTRIRSLRDFKVLTTQE
jgi:hypothetical protein